LKNLYRAVLAAIAALLLVACSLAGLLQGTGSTPAEVIEVTPLPDMTNQQNSQGLGETPMSPDDQVTACLAGTWKATNLNESILAAIPQETIDQYKLKYRSTSGALYMTFNTDGTAQLIADQLKMEFGAKVSFFTVPLVVSLDGIAAGKYTADASTITTSDFSTSGLSASAKAAGQEVVSQDQILSAIPMLQPPFNSATYICSGDTLQASVSGYPAGIPPLTFERVK
jgi:hypothetical protein